MQELKDMKASGRVGVGNQDAIRQAGLEFSDSRSIAESDPSEFLGILESHKSQAAPAASE